MCACAHVRVCSDSALLGVLVWGASGAAVQPRPAPSASHSSPTTCAHNLRPQPAPPHPWLALQVLGDDQGGSQYAARLAPAQSHNLPAIDVPSMPPGLPSPDEPPMHPVQAAAHVQQVGWGWEGGGVDVPVPPLT